MSLTPGMKVADIGCGRSPFIPFLVQDAKVEVTGVDPDIQKDGGQSESTGNFGVTHSFAARVGFSLLEGGIENIPIPDSSLDRVYSISVIEHIPQRDIRNDGMREIARVLKPGGIAVITLDVNLCRRIANPLELIWESGLEIVGGVNLTPPKKRFGRFYTGKESTDVFGFVLEKKSDLIEVDYDDTLAEAWTAGSLRLQYAPMWEDPLKVRPIDLDWYKHLIFGFEGSRPTWRRILKVLWTHGTLR